MYVNPWEVPGRGNDVKFRERCHLFPYEHSAQSDVT